MKMTTSNGQRSSARRASRWMGVAWACAVAGLAVALAMGDAGDAGARERASADELTPVEFGDQKPGKSPGKKSGESYDDHVKAMVQHAKRGQYGAALYRCKKAYRMKVSTSLATKCGVFACRIKKQSSVKRFYRATDEKGKSFIRQICASSGVAVED